jgi:MFS transporter, FSR family, fosmidomycin resistance protein
MYLMPNILAFGLQFIFGLATDYFKSPKLTALLGSVMTLIAAIIFSFAPVLAIVLTSIGNALFHVGAGSISLNLTPRKATAPGIFVAPGAIGILVGTLVGKTGSFVAWQFALLLAILGILIMYIKEPEIDYNRHVSNEKGKLNCFEVIMFLVLLSVVVRSLVGSVLIFPWKSEMALLIILTAAVVLGKSLGGILADKFGWMPIGIGSLLLSIPLLVFGANIPYLAIIGIFLFNITMPITLVTMSNILPGRPAFAFGLTCLALIFGALPVFSTFSRFLGQNWVIFTTILISSVALYYGLSLYFKNISRDRWSVSSDR